MVKGVTNVASLPRCNYSSTLIAFEKDLYVKYCTMFRQISARSRDVHNGIEPIVEKILISLEAQMYKILIS